MKKPPPSGVSAGNRRQSPAGPVEADSGDGEHNGTQWEHVGVVRGEIDWLLEPDAPLSLPLLPAPRPEGTSLAASRASSRPASCLSGSCPGSHTYSSDVPQDSAASALLSTSSEKSASSAEQQLMMFQLPIKLPAMALELSRGVSENGLVSGAAYLTALAGGGGGEGSVSSVTQSMPTKLAELGCGKLGELFVRRSGRTTLRMGDHVLDIHPGTQCSFEQEIVAMHMPSSPGAPTPMYRLGKMSDRLVCTPDLDRLLRRFSASEHVPR